jgi:hypothetical protein
LLWDRYVRFCAHNRALYLRVRKRLFFAVKAV